MRAIVEQHRKTAAHEQHLGWRVALLCVAAAVFAVSGVLYLFHYQVDTIDFNESGSTNYQVCLKENQYFSEKCLPKGRQYIASIIDNVDLIFDYQATAEQPLNFSYTYSIKGQVTAAEKGSEGKLLYDNTETLLATKSGQAEAAKTLNLRETQQLNYDHYNSLINEFRQAYALTLDANLKVTMQIAVDMTDPKTGESNHATHDLSVTIPLSERTINVAIGSQDLHHDGAIEHRSRPMSENILYLVLMGISAAGFIFLAILTARIVVGRERAESDYDKELSKILREYNQLIVDARTIPDVPRNNVIQVESFDELLDVRDTLQRPIIHIPISPAKSIFAIEDGKLAYIFVLAGQSRRPANTVDDLTDDARAINAGAHRRRAADLAQTDDRDDLAEFDQTESDTKTVSEKAERSKIGSTKSINVKEEHADGRPHERSE